jgi:hypothetical protein
LARQTRFFFLVCERDLGAKGGGYFSRVTKLKTSVLGEIHIALSDCLRIAFQKVGSDIRIEQAKIHGKTASK